MGTTYFSASGNLLYNMNLIDDLDPSRDLSKSYKNLAGSIHERARWMNIEVRIHSNLEKRPPEEIALLRQTMNEDMRSKLSALNRDEPVRSYYYGKWLADIVLHVALCQKEDQEFVRRVLKPLIEFYSNESQYLDNVFTSRDILFEFSRLDDELVSLWTSGAVENSDFMRVAGVCYRLSRRFE